MIFNFLNHKEEAAMKTGRLSVAPCLWVPVRVLAEGDEKRSYVAESLSENETFFVGADLWISVFVEDRNPAPP